MSTNQLHGKQFEQEVLATCFGLTDEQQREISSGAVFDIPAGIVTCKHPSGDPVSIKSAAQKRALSAVVAGLSDARRVWAWEGPVRLVVGVFSQTATTKLFHTVFEFQFSLDSQERLALYGTVTSQEVRDFHEAISLSRYPQGQHTQARKCAKALKERLKPRCGAIQLNPKIDSKTQRRLQCSARVTALQAACKNYICTNTNYRGLALPFTLEGTAREFS